MLTNTILNMILDFRTILGPRTIFPSTILKLYSASNINIKTEINIEIYKNNIWFNNTKIVQFQMSIGTIATSVRSWFWNSSQISTSTLKSSPNNFISILLLLFWNYSSEFSISIRFFQGFLWLVSILWAEFWLAESSLEAVVIWKPGWVLPRRK